MDEEYQKKLTIAKKAYKQIIELFELHQSCSPYEMNFCWDECIWVDDELFHSNDMRGD